MRSGALATDEGAERGGSGVLHEAARGIVERFRKECGRACLVLLVRAVRGAVLLCVNGARHGMWRRRVGASGRALGALCTAERKRGHLAAWRFTTKWPVSAHGRRCHWVWHAPSATLDPYASMLSFNSGDGGHSGWRPVSGHVIVRSKESARPCSDLSVAFGRCVPVCVVHCSWYRGTGS